VVAFVKQLKTKKKWSTICICDSANNSTSKLMPKCVHEFHESCIVDYMLFNIQYSSFSCPICETSSSEEIKKVKAGGPMLKQVKEEEAQFVDHEDKVVKINLIVDPNAHLKKKLQQKETEANSEEEQAFSNN